MSYLRFVERPQDPSRKTPVFDVMSAQRTNLAVIGFFPRWRKFICEFQPKTVFDPSCMREIADFTEAQTEKWKASLGH